jgi:glycopeptide antibiotics resistance protein
MRHLIASNVPWFLPGVALAALVGIVVARPLGRLLGTSPVVAWALVVSVGITLAATLTPLGGELELGAQGGQACDFGRIGLPPLEEFLRIDDTSLNVALFVPLGVVIGLLPRSGRKLVVLGGAIALPFVIEMAQLLLVALNRACQSADVFDNLTGLALGLIAGSVAGGLVSHIRLGATATP